MKNILFVVVMVTAVTISKGADLVHLGCQSPAPQEPTDRSQTIQTAAVNGIVGGVLVLGVSVFFAMRWWRRYKMQPAEVLHLQPAMTENSLSTGVETQLFTIIPQPFTTPLKAQVDPGLEGGGGAEPSPDPRHAKDSILIVEDNTDMREYMATILRDQHYAVFTACNGDEAIRLVQRHVPSLVLSDLMMPKMDGLEMTRHLKQDERTSHIPVILLTARNEVESKLDGLKTGADDYLTKPFMPEELLVRISNLIAQRKRLQGKFRERIVVNPTPTTEMSLDDRFLNKARTVVESNISDYTFTVEKMADEMHLSRTQLLRKLKSLTGFSPNDFIKDIRLKRAADMINRKTDTITQIGFAVGFNDQSYFTKCFKKQFGATPSEFSMQATAREDGDLNKQVY